MQIYAITEVGKDSPVKIGFSFDPHRRAQTMATESVNALIVGHAVDCELAAPKWFSSNPWLPIRSAARHEEARVHNELNAFKRRGEWFDIDWRLAASVIDKVVSTAKAAGG